MDVGISRRSESHILELVKAMFDIAEERCGVIMDVRIRKVHKDSARRDAMMPSYPCFITICGVHNHSTSSADALRQLRVLPGTKEIFEKYFDIGMTSAQAARYHPMKLNLVDDLVGQASNAVTQLTEQLLTCVNNSFKRSMVV
ncbi:hypothetical protein GWK47_002800 [Chionoecetes opilio]|uniref:Uncharacterized protein n=1 Tax=Chionoecetes opilio TaxID=41210 RepID=A0A8J4XKW7_CHIOP|nr:hypothetical protein GWK47_002800 [Chionoecetes opilio]